MPCLAVKMFVTCHWPLVKVWSEGLNSIWPRVREEITCLHYRGMIPYLENLRKNLLYSSIIYAL